MRTFFLVLGILIISAILWLALQWRTFLDTPLVAMEEEPVVVHVTNGSSLNLFASELHQIGILTHPKLFVLLARIQGKTRQIKAGEYRIESGTRPERLLRQIVDGAVLQRSVTIVEGWTFKQALAALKQNTYLDNKLESDQPEEIMKQLGFAGEHPEGRFLPETYFFTKGASDIDILLRAHTALSEHLSQAWPHRAEDLPYKTPEEALIVASLVEKETAVDQEREQVAGVIIRRLKNNMRLQIDPTVIYGMGDDYQGKIRKKDLLKNTPYNTYTNKGLPPTPIAMPSRASIDAALHPDKGDAIYFVARGDGSHQFSKTLAEHQKAVKQYILKQ